MDHTRLQSDPNFITFFVPGVPVQQGSKTLGRNKDGDIFMREAAKGLSTWRKAVKLTAAATAGRLFEPLDGPLISRLRFIMPRPASHPKTILTLPASAPDVDKLARAVHDALKDAKVIVDDSRIVDLYVKERYPDELFPKPGVQVSVAMMRESDL